jgi:hypothetical protein
MTGSTVLAGLAGGRGLAALRCGFSAIGSETGFGTGAATTGGATSITGRLTPISANGTFHSNPSSRPFGDTGSQR